MVMEKGNALTPHALHGSPASDVDSEEWHIVDEDQVDELLRTLAKLRKLLLLVLGLAESDLELIEKCFGETQQ